VLISELVCAGKYRRIVLEFDIPWLVAVAFISRCIWIEELEPTLLFKYKITELHPGLNSFYVPL